MKKYLWALMLFLIIPLGSAALDTDLVAYYTFEEVSGDLINQLNGLYNGTVTGATQGVQGIIANGYDFDGSTDLVDIQNHDSLAPVNNSVGTFSGWLRPDFYSNATGTRYAVAGADSEAFLILFDEPGANNDFSIHLGGTKVISLPISTIRWFDPDQWVHMALTWNDTSNNVTFWINGTVIASNITAFINTTVTNLDLGDQRGLGRFFDGSMDEFAFWNRQLSDAEIVSLWNNGGARGVLRSTVLEYPNIGDQIVDSPLFLNASYFVPSGRFLTNATSLLYNSTGALIYSNFSVITGLQNSTSHAVTLTSPGDYIFNAESCDDNNVCVSATQNHTFFYGYTVINESWQGIVTEGETNLFSTNISIAPGVVITQAQLNYSGVLENGIIQNVNSSDYYITRTRTAPSVVADTDFGFNWVLTFSSGAITSLTNHSQQVNNLAIDACDSFSLVILNYSTFDEATTNELSTASIQVDVDLSPLGSTTPIISFSGNSTGNIAVCLPAGTMNSTSFRLDAQASYVSENYSSEFHHIQNYTLSNATANQNISLFDLLSVDSTEFLITFKDASFIPVEDALIDITRKYVSEGLFRSVEVPKTDENGQAQGHFDTQGVIYTIIVSKNGAILATFDDVTISCQNPSLEDCELNLNAFTSTTPLQDFQEYAGITYTLNFNRSTRTVTSTFTTTDGSSRTILLNTTVFNAYNNITACSDTLTSSSGTLTCIIPTIIGNTTVITKLFSGSTLVAQALFSLEESPSDIFGQTGIILVIVMYSMLPLMFISNPIGIVVASIIAVIMAVLLNLLDTNSLVGAGSTLGWLIIAGLIIIWRISRGTKE